MPITRRGQLSSAPPPPIPTEVVKYLERIFPVQLPGLHDGSRIDEVALNAAIFTGRRDVVEHLKAIHDRQQKNVLES